MKIYGSVNMVKQTIIAQEYAGTCSLLKLLSTQETPLLDVRFLFLKIFRKIQRGSILFRSWTPWTIAIGGKK